MGSADYPQVVLVTGVSRRLGGLVASRLQADPRIERVVGVDAELPAEGAELEGVDFRHVDIRTTAIAEVLEAARVDTVVHCGLVATPSAVGGRPTMKEINVIGTMQLLAACQRTPHMRRLVVRSTAAIYGSSPHAPALFTEDMEPIALPQHGYAKDVWEVEGYVRGFARRCPHVSATTLRFANFIGPGVDSPLAQYLSLPLVPTVWGFDPRLQFVHESDGVEALRRAATSDHPGTFNVSGSGVIMLSQAIRRAGRPAVPVPAQLMQPGGEFLRRMGAASFSSDQIELLRHGRAVDTSRVAAALGWRPGYSTVAAFDDFVRRQLRTRSPGSPVAGGDRGAAGMRS